MLLIFGAPTLYLSIETDRELTLNSQTIKGPDGGYFWDYKCTLNCFFLALFSFPLKKI